MRGRLHWCGLQTSKIKYLIDVLPSTRSIDVIMFFFCSVCGSLNGSIVPTINFIADEVMMIVSIFQLENLPINATNSMTVFRRE